MSWWDDQAAAAATTEQVAETTTATDTTAAKTTDTTATTGTKPKLTAQEFIVQWQQSHPASEGIGPLAEAMKAAGYGNVTRFMYGATPSNNELSIDGQKFKVLGAENSSNPFWYTAGTDDGRGAGYGNKGYGDFQNAPGAFVAPTGLTLENDPGYMARLKMGTDALQGAAAAKGSILSGGTLKALDRYTQDYASNEFGNVYARALQGYTTNVGTQRNAMNDYWQREQDLRDAALKATTLTK